MAITSKIRGERGRRQGEGLGIEAARIPPGQHLIAKVPILTDGRDPKVDLAPWSLSNVLVALTTTATRSPSSGTGSE